MDSDGPGGAAVPRLVFALGPLSFLSTRLVFTFNPLFFISTPSKCSLLLFLYASPSVCRSLRVNRPQRTVWSRGKVGTRKGQCLFFLPPLLPSKAVLDKATERLPGQGETLAARESQRERAPERRLQSDTARKDSSPGAVPHCPAPEGETRAAHGTPGRRRWLPLSEGVLAAPRPSTHHSLYLRVATPSSSRGSFRKASYLVDPASSHMLVSKIKPCMCKYKPVHGETANGSLNQLWFLRSSKSLDNCSNSRANTCDQAPIPREKSAFIRSRPAHRFGGAPSW